MPIQTIINDIIPITLNTLPSFSNIADNITPHIGFRKPYIATFPTGLYFKSIAHNEYAIAEMKAI